MWGKHAISIVLALSLAVSVADRLPVRAAAAPLPADRLHFGLANGPGDLGWMTASGVPWRYRYQYLAAGVNTGSGWQTWQESTVPPGMFATRYLNDSSAAGYIPVFTYYMLLQSNPSSGANESDRDFSNLNNVATMSAYYADFKVLMQRSGSFGKQAVVHVEPDLWGYLQQRGGGGPASSLPASVGSTGADGTAGLPDTVAGFGTALVRLRDTYAPNVALAAHASLWASGFDVGTNTSVSLDVTGIADRTAAFLGSAGSWDLVFNDVDDHDAGWWERVGGTTAHWWDAGNSRFPNFSRYLAWVAEMRLRTGRPQVVWQVPVGNQRYLTMNNTDGHYQDNVAEYFLAHPTDLYGAGLVAVLFGSGNAGQTTYTDAKRDGVTNNSGNPTTDPAGACNACNTTTSQFSDDDGGFLRTAVGHYYQAATCVPASGVPPSGGSAYYFAEGFTGPGFAETLSLLAPAQGGSAFIDFYTESGHSACTVSLTAGVVAHVDVNAAVGAGHQVSARVSLPVGGVAERLLHFRFGQWHGSTDVVGATQPASEWDFAEGSTLSAFSEYLTLQNPGAADVVTDLNYFTDTAGHPTRTVTVPAQSRATVQVFDPAYGVGPGVQGVSVQVRARGGGQIIAERPMYVNAFTFNGLSTPIADGHDAFGANVPATSWYLAEGTTLPGFLEYLTIQNPGAVGAQVNIAYLTDGGVRSARSVTVASQSRSTIEVFNPRNGVGVGIGGVSTQVTSDQPVVVERPMYVSHDFGGGPVAGAHVVMGATSLGTGFAFAQVTTVAGENDFLTIQNPGSAPAMVTLNYYVSGGTQTRTLTVPAATRQTIQSFDGALGVGPGQGDVGVVLHSNQPVLVEKPTYGSNDASYGATDTMGAAA